MAPSPDQNTEYLLFYSSRDHFVIGAFLLLISFGIAALLFLQQIEAPTRNILFGVFVMVTGVGLYVMGGWFWRRRSDAWYLCFLPNQVRINFHNDPGASPDAQPDDAILDIPRDQLVWIRKTEKTAWDTDEYDKFFVEMCVTHQLWQEAKNLKTLHSKYDPFTTRPEIGSVQFFEGDILRVFLDGTRWPEDLDAHWRMFDYPIGEDYLIKHVTSLELAKSAPRQFF